MPELTIEEIRALPEDQYVEYLRQQAGVTAAPATAAAPSTIATGEAPTVGPSSLTTAQGQLLTESRARQLALDSAPGMSTAQKLGLAIAAGSDAAGQLAAIRRGKSAPPSTFDDLAKGVQQQGAKRQEQSLAERKFQADLMNNISAAGPRELEVWQKSQAIVADALKNPLSSDEDKERAVTLAIGHMARAGMDTRLAGEALKSMTRPDMQRVATMLGSYSKAYDPNDVEDQKRLKLMMQHATVAVHSGAAGVKGLPDLIEVDLVSKIGPEVSLLAVETARNLRGNPAFKEGIPVEVLYDKFEAKYRGKDGAQAAIAYLNGTLGTSDQAGQTKYQNFMTAMTNMGFRGIDVAGKAQAAGATSRATAQATADVKTDPGNVAREVAAENQKETGTRPGKMETLGQQEQMKHTVGEQYRRPETIAERLSLLKQKADKGDKAAKLEYDSTLQVEKELRESGATRVNLPQQLPAGAVEKIADMQGFSARLKQVRGMHRGSYTGPADQYLASLRAKTGIEATDHETVFRQVLTGLRNELTLLRSGAAVTPPEYERILTELPSERDPDAVFLRKADSAMQQVDAAIKRRIKGYEAFGFKVGALAAEEPGAPDAKPAPTTPREKENAVREKYGLPTKK